MKLSATLIIVCMLVFLASSVLAQVPGPVPGPAPLSASDYEAQWTAGLSAGWWMLKNVQALLGSAAAVRLVTFIYNPHRSN